MDSDDSTDHIKKRISKEYDKITNKSQERGGRREIGYIKINARHEKRLEGD